MRRIISWLTLPIALLSGAVAATVVFVIALSTTNAMPVVIFVSLLACLLVTIGVAWRALGRIGGERRARAGLALGTTASLGIGLLAWLSIFQPLEPFVPVPPAPVLPRHGGYWTLSTGSRIAYLKVPAIGARKPTPIIVIHGGPGAFEVTSADSRTYFSPYARYGYDVYFYDQIGSGLSARLSDVSQYTVARHVADLEAIRKRIGARRVVLVGGSWGGTLIANYLAAHPGHVARAILTSPAAINYTEWKRPVSSMSSRLPPERRLQWDRFFNRPRLLAWALLAQVSPRAAGNFVSNTELDRYMDSSFGLWSSALACNPAHVPHRAAVNGFGLAASIMTQSDPAMRHANPEARLRRDHTPVLIVTGPCNYIAWPVTYQYRRTLPNSTLVVLPGAGHVVYYDRPRLYFRLVRAFLLDWPLPLQAYTATTPPR